MITGNVAVWMGRLKEGEAVDLHTEDIIGSAMAYLDSALDFVRKDDIDRLISDIKNHTDFLLSENIHPKNGKRWTLYRLDKKDYQSR